MDRNALRVMQGTTRSLWMLTEIRALITKISWYVPTLQDDCHHYTEPGQRATRRNRHMFFDLLNVTNSSLNRQSEFFQT